MTELPEDMGELVQFPGRREQDQADVGTQNVGTPDPATGQPTAVPLPGDVLPPRWSAPIERRPVLAQWLVNRDDRRAAARWAASHLGHLTAFHGVRVPTYVGRLAGQSPRGLARVVAGLAHWLSDGEARPLRRDTVGASDVSGYLSLVRQRNERIKQRLIVAGTGAGSGVGGGAALWELAPHSVSYLAAAAVVAGLGLVGRRADKPIVAHAIVPQAARRLTPDVVSHAFVVAKLATDKDRVAFAEPISRDGAGFRVVVDLPLGQTADKAMARRVEIASGLDRDERQVFLSRQRGGTGSARRVVMWVADVDPLSVPAGRSPLVTTARVNFWEGFPFGVNERGATVPLCLMWTAMLVGAIPRMGKSFAARLPALAAALDPDVRIYCYDFKGSPDWVPFRHVAYRIQFGDRPDPETGVDPVAEFLADMLALQAEVDHRYRTLRNLPASVTPEGKLTESIARNKRFGMPVVLVVADEIQRALGHATYGKEIEAVLTDLVKAAPAVGIHLLASTQKPDASSMPSGFRDQFGVRFALRVMSRDVSEVVLGAGANAEGLNAATLSPDAKGVGLLRGTGDSGEEVTNSVVRTFLADGRDAEAICKRGRALREAAGTLAGAAVGESPVAERHAHNVVEDLAVVFGTDAQLHADTLCARLAEEWPDRYAGWAPAQLSAALKPHDITPRPQVWATAIDTGKNTNRTGYHRVDFTDRA